VGLGAGVAVGFRFHNGFLPGVAGLLLVLAFSYAMSWEMAWIALKVKDPETAQVAGILPVVPVTYLALASRPAAVVSCAARGDGGRRCRFRWR
jgi:ABC-2 type transport system permease protein